MQRHHRNKSRPVAWWWYHIMLISWTQIWGYTTDLIILSASLMYIIYMYSCQQYRGKVEAVTVRLTVSSLLLSTAEWCLFGFCRSRNINRRSFCTALYRLKSYCKIKTPLLCTFIKFYDLRGCKTSLFVKFTTRNITTDFFICCLPCSPNL